MYDVFVGVHMTSLLVFRQTFGYSTLLAHNQTIAMLLLLLLARETVMSKKKNSSGLLLTAPAGPLQKNLSI